MTEFRIQIAGVTAAVTGQFESTGYYCRNYFSEEPPAFSIAVTGEDLENEQALLRREALEEGLRPRVFPEPFLERSVIQRKLADLLLSQDVLLFHGSTVALDGAAYLFTAPCGTGKSTHTRLWREAFGEAVMVNDDKPFLRFTTEGVLACGAPWSGKHGLDTNIAVPLRGICILERGSENRIVPATAAQREFLLTQRHRPEDPEKDRLSAALTEALMDRVPVWYMTCTKDPDAPLVSRRAMASY